MGCKGLDMTERLYVCFHTQHMCLLPFKMHTLRNKNHACCISKVCKEMSSCMQIWRTCKKWMISRQYWPCFYLGSKNARDSFIYFISLGRAEVTYLKKKNHEQCNLCSFQWCFFFLSTILPQNNSCMVQKSKKENLGKNLTRSRWMLIAVFIILICASLLNHRNS